MYSKNPPSNTLSIYLSKQTITASIYRSTLVMSPMAGFEFYFLQGVRHPLPQGPHRPLLLNTSWNELNCRAHLLHSDPADRVQNNQFFLQSTSMLDGHDRIIPVSDHQARVVPQDSQFNSAVQPFHQVRHIAYVLIFFRRYS